MRRPPQGRMERRDGLAAVLFKALNTPRAAAPLGWIPISDGQAAAFTPRGNMVLVQEVPSGVTAEFVRATATRLRSCALYDLETEQPADLGAMDDAFASLEPIALAEGRLPDGLAWAGWAPSRIKRGDWTPGPVTDQRTEIHMVGRHGRWIAARSGLGWTASLGQWSHFQKWQEKIDPYDFGSWQGVMEYCRERDASARC